MLPDYQIDAAHQMAARGLGHEDICVKLGIRDKALGAQVRRIVLRRPLLAALITLPRTSTLIENR